MFIKHLSVQNYLLSFNLLVVPLLICSGHDLRINRCLQLEGICFSS